MATSRLDAETVSTALALANRAPSVHNSQPWRWEVGQHSVHLYADTSLHLPHTDPDRRDLLVSCGAALHHGAVAFAALGWGTRIVHFPNPAEPTHLASIEVWRHTPSDNDIALAGAIGHRRTDRRAFGSRPVPVDDVALMGARAARLGVTLRRIEIDERFRLLLAAAVADHAADAEYLRDLANWTGRHASVAGVPAKSATTSDQRAPIPGRIFATASLAQAGPRPADPDGSVLLGLGTAADAPVDQLRAGEATSAVLLAATSRGLATCPVTEPLEVSSTREQLRRWDFDSEQYPQMLIKVGWAAEGAEPLPATPRRPIAQSLTFLNHRTT